jgi:RNA polymerase sigma factor (sigma-70 family)
MSTAVLKKTSASQEQDWESDVEKHYQSLLRYSLILTHNRSDAEEIVQEVFTRLLYRSRRASPVRRQISDYPSYLRTMAKHVFWDSRQRERHRHVSLDQKENKAIHNQLVDVSTSEAIQSQLYHEELMDSLPLRVVLKGLSNEDLKMLRMAAIDEMSCKEIAEELRQDVDSVRYKLQCIYSKVRYRARKIISRPKRSFGSTPVTTT